MERVNFTFKEEEYSRYKIDGTKSLDVNIKKQSADARKHFALAALKATGLALLILTAIAGAVALVVPFALSLPALVVIPMVIVGMVSLPASSTFLIIAAHFVVKSILKNRVEFEAADAKAQIFSGGRRLVKLHMNCIKKAARKYESNGKQDTAIGTSLVDLVDEHCYNVKNQTGGRVSSSTLGEERWKELLKVLYENPKSLESTPSN